MRVVGTDWYQGAGVEQVVQRMENCDVGMGMVSEELLGLGGQNDRGWQQRQLTDCTGMVFRSLGMGMRLGVGGVVAVVADGVGGDDAVERLGRRQRRIGRSPSRDETLLQLIGLSEKRWNDILLFK